MLVSFENIATNESAKINKLQYCDFICGSIAVRMGQSTKKPDFSTLHSFSFYIDDLHKNQNKRKNIKNFELKYLQKIVILFILRNLHFIAFIQI